MKRLLSMLMITVLFLGLCACGSTSNEDGGGASASTAPTESLAPGGAASESTEASGSPVTITFADQVANVQESSKYLWEAANAFMEQNPDITIEFQGADHDDHISKLKMAAQSNTLPDVFWLEVSMIGEFADNGYIMDLTDEATQRGIMDCFAEGMLDVNTYNGQLYGLPSEVMMPCYFYNKTIFEENGLAVPETHEDLLEVCKTLSEKGITPVAKGSMSTWSVWCWQNIFVQYGFFDKIDAILAGEDNFNNSDFKKALDRIGEMRDAGAYPENVTTMDYFQAIEVFLAGNAAMLESGNFACRDLENSEISDQIGCFLGPIMPESTVENPQTIIRTYNGPYTVSSAVAEDAAKMDAVFRFFEFFYGPTGTQIVADNGMVPTSKFSGSIDAESRPIFADLVEKFNDDSWNNTLQPYGYLSPSIADSFADGMWGVALNNYTIDDALDQIENEIDLSR